MLEMRPSVLTLSCDWLAVTTSGAETGCLRMTVRVDEMPETDLSAETCFSVWPSLGSPSSDGRRLSVYRG